MKKDFKEEKVQKDQMDEEQFAVFLQEQMKKEAEQIEKELADHPELAGLSPDDRAKDRLFEKIEEYERRKAIENLSPEDQEALRLGRKVQKEQAEKSRKKKKRHWKQLVAGLAVIVLAGTAGMTGLGGPARVMEVMKQMVGGREMTQVESDDKNTLQSGESEEEKAYQEIKDTLGIDPVRVVDHQLNLKFLYMELEKELGTATLFYDCEGRALSYIMTCSYQSEVWGFDIEDGLMDEYVYPLEETEVQIREYKVEDTENHKYTASFEYRDVHYQLTGMLTKKELEEILDNLYFM